MPWRPLPSPVGDDQLEDTIAIRVKRAITVSGETIDDATILVRGGRIAAIGKIVEVPKGARRLDYSEWTAMPGLVLALSRGGFVPRAPLQGAATKGRDGIDVDSEVFEFAAKAGITTMAVVPQGSGIIGQATVVRTAGESLDDRILVDSAYLFSSIEMSTTGKDQLRTAFEKARDIMEQMEKQAKDAAAAPASIPASGPATRPATAPATQPAQRPATQPAAATPAPTPVKPDARTEVLIRVLKKEMALWTQLGGVTPGGYSGFGGSAGATTPAPEILHLGDALKKFDVNRVYFGGANAALALDAIRAVKAAVVLPAEENTFEPFTRNWINGAEELRRAGVKVALLPNGDSRDAYRNWLYKTGQMVRFGFPEAEAIRAVTLTPAELLGVSDRVGALTTGKDADILFLDGAPFEVSSKIRRVMIAGHLMPEDEELR